MVNFSSEKWFTETGFYSYEINSSVRFNADQNSNATRTPSSASNRKIFTWSSWVKRNQLATNMRLFEGFTDTNNFSSIVLGGSDNLQVVFLDSGSAVYNLITTAVLRDTSSWYHIVVAVDTTQSSSSNRVKVYINGEQQTSFGTNTVGSQDFNTEINNNTSHAIGRYLGASQYYLDAYLAEMNFIDGSQLTPDSFGETKQGVWIPKKYSGSYGTNGFYLKFNDASSGNRGDDSSGNGNDFSTSAVNAADTNLPDTPTNNFGTMNINNPSNTGTADFSIGNTKITLADNEEAFGTFGVSSGKWYYEVLHISSASSNNKIAIGIADADNPSNNEQVNFGHQATTYGVGDIISVAVDVDAETITFRKNNTAIETDTDWSSKGFTTIVPFLTSANSAGNEVAMFNFGSDSSFNTNKTPQNNSDENGHGDFFYTPPSGFLAMCAANLPEPSISPLNGEKPADYFDTLTYTGNATNGHERNGTSFQPDWLWGKHRSGTNSHQIFDSTRGVTKNLKTNTTDSEGTSTSILASFDADGFTLNSSGGLNKNVNTFVAWLWRANGGTTSNNSDGSITSTVQVNTEAGFSIAAYTGTGSSTTIGHGLGAVPDVIIIKCRSTTKDWYVWNASTAGTGYLHLNQDVALITDANRHDRIGNVSSYVAPTSSVITLGTSSAVNGSSATYIMYTFAEIEGYSKFGSYTGNGSTDGPFIYTGFRPAFFMTKRTDSTSNWLLFDNKRGSFNLNDNYLYPNLSQQEGTSATLGQDFLSNGVKILNDYGDNNASGGTYFYMAFAEMPFKYANGR